MKCYVIKCSWHVSEDNGTPHCHYDLQSLLQTWGLGMLAYLPYSLHISLCHYFLFPHRTPLHGHLFQMLSVRLFRESLYHTSTHNYSDAVISIINKRYVSTLNVKDLSRGKMYVVTYNFYLFILCNHSPRKQINIYINTNKYLSYVIQTR
jgi:hypothetical protein